MKSSHLLFTLALIAGLALSNRSASTAEPVRWQYHMQPDAGKHTYVVVDSLGEAGWELINYVPPGKTDFGGYYGIWIFKRPL